MKPSTLQQDAEKFAAFIVANYPGAKQWEDPVRQAAWYIAHAFVAVVTDEDEEIVALCAARPVERPGIGVLPWYYNPTGKCLHVDLWIDISGNDRARVALRTFFQWRFPQCTTIAMFRHFEEGLRTYDIERFWKHFEKLKRVKRKKKENKHEPATTT
jgi:hypothetical protein